MTNQLSPQSRLCITMSMDVGLYFGFIFKRMRLTSVVVVVVVVLLDFDGLARLSALAASLAIVSAAAVIGATVVVVVVVLSLKSASFRL